MGAKAGRRLQILFLTQVLPYPLVGGAKIRAYYMLRHLARTHDVTLVSFVRPDDGWEAVDHLQQYCQAVYTVPMERSRWRDVLALAESVLRGRPAVIARDRIAAMQALLRHLAEAHVFDVVHADQTAMAQYGRYVCAQYGRRGPRFLLDQHNALYRLVGRQAQYERGPARWLWRREARLLQAYEREVCRSCDAVLTVTEQDRELLLALFDEGEREAVGERFTSLPICVDPAAQEPLAYVNEGPQIVHLGTMFWPPNVDAVLWFARKVLPRVVSAVPDATFTIAGKEPPPEVVALAEEGALANHVRVTGFVADAEPLLARCRAFVVPVRAGGGMRVKIVDGWQRGLPIVSTRLGAEGIDTRPGENILLADEPAAFAEAVVRVLTDAALNRSLREAGRRWVERHYDWRTVYTAVDEIYSKMAAAGG